MAQALLGRELKGRGCRGDQGSRELSVSRLAPMEPVSAGVRGEDGAGAHLGRDGVCRAASGDV